MEINHANLSRLFAGYNTRFNRAFADVPTAWGRVAMEVPSSSSEEEYDWLGNTTRMREWLGDRVIQNVRSHGYVIRNKSFEDTVGVNRDRIEDDKYGVYGPMIDQLGADAAAFPDQLVFDLVKAGGATLCWDGQYFFDSDHPVLQADGTYGSASNVGGGSGTAWYLLDVSKPVKPFIFQRRKPFKFTALDNDRDENVYMRKQFIYGVDGRCNVGFGLWQLAYMSKQDLTPDNYFAARQAMRALKGDNGRPLNINPGLLLVPSSLEKKALEAVTTERLANGADNVAKGTATVLCTSWVDP